VKHTPHLIQLSADDPLPDPHSAWGSDTVAPGLLAIGGGLSVERLMQAYGQGCFPWYSEGQPIMWWFTDPRMVLQVNYFRLHQSLRKILINLLKLQRLEIRIDQSFARVIQECAQSNRQGQSGTWIVKEMIEAYIKLHQQGYAHSVEAWIDGNLAGGLYCVSIGHSVFGESMFTLQTDGSKMALAGLVALCQAQDVQWIDCQQNTLHLSSLGAAEIPKSQFLGALAEAIKLDTLVWEFEPLYWNKLMHKQI
jgi:leucyl/phenylalanyl-tRNA--protein transferase